MIKAKLYLTMVLHNEVAAEVWMHMPPRVGETVSLSGEGSDAVYEKYGSKDFEVTSVQHKVILGERAPDQAHEVSVFIKRHGAASSISPEARKLTGA